MESFRDLPSDLPVPEDDGAADHLRGAELPPITLPATSGEDVNLADAAAETLVLYVYPRTGVPGQPLPEGWDEIPAPAAARRRIAPSATSTASFARSAPPSTD